MQRDRSEGGEVVDLQVRRHSHRRIMTTRNTVKLELIQREVPVGVLASASHASFSCGYRIPGKSVCLLNSIGRDPGGPAPRFRPGVQADLWQRCPAVSQDKLRAQLALAFSGDDADEAEVQASPEAPLEL
jgi:hypothetical protein